MVGTSTLISCPFLIWLQARVEEKSAWATPANLMWSGVRINTFDPGAMVFHFAVKVIGDGTSVGLQDSNIVFIHGLNFIGESLGPQPVKI